MDNVALAKKAYSWTEVSASERTRKDFEPYFDLLADDVVFKGAWSESTPVYGGEFRGREAVKKLIWEDDRASVSGNDLEAPSEYIAIEDDSVAIVNKQCYQIKKTGAWVQGIDSCTIMTFRDGLIERIVSIQDISAWNFANIGN